MKQFNKNLRYLLAIVIVFTTFPLEKTYAQLRSPNISLETYGIVSSSGTTPFWLQSNRHGMFATNGSQFMTRIQAHSTNNQLTDNLNLSYGADFIARPGTQSAAWFNQGYVRLDGWNLFLQAGRFHNTSPIHDEELGMGSLGVSGNATPIPQIRAGLSDWTSLPFTRDFIQIKGHIAHGWLGSERYVSDVLYHEKVGHARFGGDFPLNLYGGLAHYALWGGTHPELGEIPSSVNDFGRVFIAVGGDANAPRGEREYMLGDHLGAWDFGFFLQLDQIDIKLYRQFPLETKDNLKLKSLQDALTGINIQFVEGLLNSINVITYEFLYTKYQDGPRRPNPSTDRDGLRGNENYYNHYLYRSGWAYNFKTIGNPLFTLRNENLGINNNRIVAHHIGINSSFNYFNLVTKFTYSRNYGNWGPFSVNGNEVSAGEPFDPKRNQLSLLVGVDKSLTLVDNMILGFNFYFDNGDLVGNQIGTEMNLKYKF